MLRIIEPWYALLEEKRRALETILFLRSFVKSVKTNAAELVDDGN